MPKGKCVSPIPRRCYNGKFQEVQVLNNSAYYFLPHSIIVCCPEEDAFRLVVIGGRQLKALDRTYRSRRSAHIAFGRRFKPFGKEIKQDWTPVYPADQGWVNVICNTVPDKGINQLD